MIPAISNIALTAYQHEDELRSVAEIGYRGLEVAPSRVWRDTWAGLTSDQVQKYRQVVERSGLNVVGLHSLVFDHPECQLFGDDEARQRTLEFMVHLSSVCRDLGGRTLVWGGGRNRGELELDTAYSIAEEFMHALCQRIEDHGTCFCFEPLGPSSSDFVNSIDDALRITKAVNHPALQVQIDVKAMVENDDVRDDVVDRARPHLVHVHVNSDGLGALAADGAIDHDRIGKILASAGYDHYVTAEQRMIDPSDAIGPARQSYTVLRNHYMNSGRAKEDANSI